MPSDRSSARPAEGPRPARLRRRVIVIGVAAIVVNAAAAAYDQWRSYRSAIDDAGRELANVARILAAEIAGNLRAVDVLLRDTAEWYAGDGRQAAAGAIDAALAGRAGGLPQLLRLSIADRRGRQLYRSGMTGTRGANISDRPYFTAPRDHPGQGPFVSGRFLTQSDGRETIALSRAVRDRDGRFAGVVSAFLDLDRMQQFYRNVNLGSQGSILFLRDDGTILLREPSAPGDAPRAIPVPPAGWIPAEGVARVLSPIDGQTYFASAALVDGFPLVIGIARRESAVLGPWRAEALRAALRTLILSLLVAAAMVALVRQLRRVENGERALRESEQRYALAMEGANEGHFDWNLQGGPSFLSATMKALLGLAPDAPVGDRARTLAGVEVDPEDRARVDAALQDHLQGQTERYEVEYRVRRPGEGDWLWLQVRGRCLRDAAGRPYRLVGSVIDVSERKRAEAEKERLEVRLRKSQKMEAIGTLAGGIAHDFNNILGAIVGYGEMAQKHAEQGSVVRRYIDNVMQAGARAKALVEGILAFSRTGVGERKLVNVQAVIEEAVDLVAASLPSGVRVERRLEAGDAAVIGDATQLYQMAINLCTNALQAMPGGGVLEVLLERANLAEARAFAQGELPPGSYLRLTVRDTGAGIKPEILDRVFDPFFTTRGVGGGTGLGLSLVHGIAADLGGAIDVASAPGRGTTFSIWLPVAGSAPPPAAEPGGELPRGNGEAVMVVDDEHALVDVAEEMLAELGYEPISFTSSTAALEAFAADPGRFDLVLTDEMMPELSGTGLAAEIRRVRPDLPIVIMTGYSDSRLAALARSAGVSEVLRKPLKTLDIALSFARMLQRHRPPPAATA